MQVIYVYMRVCHMCSDHKIVAIFFFSKGVGDLRCINLTGM